MAMNTIDRVREAERAANLALDEADEKAHQMVEEAKAEAQDIVRRAREEAELSEREKLTAAKKASDKLVAERREEALKNAAALEEKTVSLKQNIINKLIEETLL